MMKKILVHGLYAICLLSSQPAWSKSLVLKHERGVIHVDELKGWEISKDLFGLPFVYVSQKQNGQRSNISFSHTGIELKFDKKSLKKTHGQYRVGKEKWAKKVGANILKVLPYKTFKNAFGHQVHHVGIRFSHLKKSYIENSYYIECKGKMIYSKSLRLNKNKNHKNKFTKLIQGLNCD